MLCVVFRYDTVTDARLLCESPYEPKRNENKNESDDAWKYVAAAAGIGTFLLFQFPVSSALVSLSAAKGLFGAAKIASGLATLGGGSLAAGGFGMAGGQVVLTTMSVGAGVAAASVANKLQHEEEKKRE